jgi:N-acetylglucosamine kinase-like BadF-type ATPase
LGGNDSNGIAYHSTCDLLSGACTEIFSAWIDTRGSEMSRNVILGIDGGGGTTECLLADEKGKMLGKGLSAGSNIYASGEFESAKALKEAMLAAGLKADDHIISACFGLSGVIHGLDNSPVNYIVRDILPGADKIMVVNDAIVTLTGAIGAGPGICMNAGTGAICAGRNFSGKVAISSGWGNLLGDEGSGYWIGAQGMISALRYYDGRSEEETVLLERLLQTIKASTPQIASNLIYESNNSRVILSNLCPVVINCAENGDRVAYEIVRKAGCELALAVWGVAKKLSLIDTAIDVVPVGNCLLKSGLLTDLFSSALNELLPSSTVVFPRYSPVVGSLLMACMGIGVEINKEDMDSYALLSSKE